MQEFNSEQEIKDFLAQQADWLNRGVIDQQTYNQAVRDTKVGIKGFAAQLKASQEQLKKSVVGLTTSIAKGDSGASVYNNALNSGAKAIDSYAQKYGFWGKVAGTVATAAAKYAAAVNEQADKLFENYQDLSRSGLATGLDDTFKNLQKMGYTTKEIGQMGSLMKENATMMAQFGGTAATGAKEFAKLSKEIQYSDLGTQFKMMGMTVDDINKGSANYLKLQQISGTLQSQTTEELTKGSAAYIVQQDKLTKLTGATADEQTKILEDAYRQERFAAKQYQLRVLDGSEQAKKQADFNDAYLQTMTKKGGSAAGKAAQAMVVGAANDPEYIKARRSFSNANDMIRAGATDAATVFDQSTKDAAKTQKDWNLLARAGVTSEIVIDYSTLVNLGGQTAKTMEEAAKSADKQIAAQRAGADTGVKNLVDVTQAQRNQTMTAEKAMNIGLETVTSGMSILSQGIEGATDALGKLVGKEGRVGGGSSYFDKIKNLFTGGTGTTTTPSAAPAPNTSGSLANKIMMAESGGQNIDNRSGPGGKPTSSASGLYQFTRGTFNDIAKNATAGSALYGKTFEDYKQDTNLQQEAMSILLEKNAASLTKKGIATTDANMYLAHFLGASGAAKALLAGPGALLSSVMSSEQLAANPSLKSLNTVADLRAWAETKMGGAGAAGKMPTAALGGILGGPKNGYQAMLHGTEAVVPLPDGKTIPVQIAGGDSSQQQIDLLSVELEKLDAMVHMINKQNDLATKILRKQS